MNFNDIAASLTSVNYFPTLGDPKGSDRRACKALVKEFVLRYAPEPEDVAGFVASAISELTKNNPDGALRELATAEALMVGVGRAYNGEQGAARETTAAIADPALLAHAHAMRYPDGCRGTWATMCEDCCARLGAVETRKAERAALRAEAAGIIDGMERKAQREEALATAKERGLLETVAGDSHEQPAALKAHFAKPAKKTPVRFSADDRAALLKALQEVWRYIAGDVLDSTGKKAMSRADVVCTVLDRFTSVIRVDVGQRLLSGEPAVSPKLLDKWTTCSADTRETIAREAFTAKRYC
jgi:hypothetical protein